jgi:hypothetical protein
MGRIYQAMYINERRRFWRQMKGKTNGKIFARYVEFTYQVSTSGVLNILTFVIRAQICEDARAAVFYKKPSIYLYEAWQSSIMSDAGLEDRA